jgi:hypothetical protein
MTGFFTSAALTASNTTMVTDDGTAAIVWMLIGITVGMAWLAFFNHYWVAYSMNPTKIARREMQIAIFAPITVPILAAMLIVKTARGINAVAV